MKSRLNVKMEKIRLAVRVAEMLYRHEVIDVSDFCRHTDGYFQQRLKVLGQEVAQEPKPNPDDEDEMYGYEMYTEDRFLELNYHRNHGAYFGVLMVFSALERFLQSLYDLTMDVAIVPKFRNVVLEIGQKRLTLEHFKMFLKSLDIDVCSEPYQWDNLIRLQRYRNAIAHQGGRVTESNYRALSAYNHKIGEKLDVTLHYVQQVSRLTGETVRQVSRDYLKAIT